MPAAVRLDAELVRRGLARSRRRAADLIEAGRVEVAGAVATRPAQPVPPDADVAVTGADRPDYVSRAAHKLVGALDALAALAPDAPSPAGSRCLDAGASTGGFTQVLLERGAARVAAVDVGHGQLDPAIAADPRVDVHEGLNVRALRPEDVGGPVDLVVADLSFISLTVALPALLAATRPGGDLLVLVKPQFEVGRARLGSSGVVRSPELRREAVAAVADAALRLGAACRAVVPSPLPGPSGNREYFLWLVPAPAAGSGGVADGVASEVAAASEVGAAEVGAAVAAAVRDDRAVLVAGEGGAP